jgi:hypothetical protein
MAAATPTQSPGAESELIEHLASGRWKKYARFLVAALASVPWVGGVLSAAATFSSEQDQSRLSELQRLWLEEHRAKAQALGLTLEEIFGRLDGFGAEVQERIESEEYLALVRRTFRSWDQADTDSKRDMYKRLILNAGATTLCSDHLIRLFIGWIDLYHEAHFAVIREVFQHPDSTRGDIWDRMHPGERPREDSSEADLFRYLIRDLNIGGVIRQERDTDEQGNFLRKPTARPRRSAHPSAPRTTESAFEDSKPYELTELGKQFVHYVMKDVVQQLGA